jgi:uncharacterized protein with HEPN domain
MRLEARKYLYDINSACELIKEFVGEKSLDDYEKDAMLRSAVERQFMVIGEALSQLLRKWPEFEKNISNVRQIISFRNLIIHGYSTVENETVWGVVCGDMPILSGEIEGLIG